MKKMDLENKNRQVDVEVVEQLGGSLEFYTLDAFLTIPGIPDLCVGFSFQDSEIDMFSALTGKPKKYYVESPVPAGAAMEYDAVDAVKALLSENAIIVTDSGEFDVGHKSYPNAKSLKESDQDICDKMSCVVDNWDDLEAAVRDAYEGRGWE